jgi:hypothetical protein
MRPPFLQLGGEDKFADYQTEFNKLIPSIVIDVLGNEVYIARERCHHICFKEEEEGASRDQWEQERAERIPFIKAALERPKFICLGERRSWVYLYEVERDVENGLEPELFCVIVDYKNAKPGIPGRVRLLTGYRIYNQKWTAFKQNHLQIYPHKPLKPKKKK